MTTKFSQLQQKNSKMCNCVLSQRVFFQTMQLSSCLWDCILSCTGYTTMFQIVITSSQCFLDADAFQTTQQDSKQYNHVLDFENKLTTLQVFSRSVLECKIVFQIQNYTTFYTAKLYSLIQFILYIVYIFKHVLNSIVTFYTAWKLFQVCIQFLTI